MSLLNGVNLIRIKKHKSYYFSVLLFVAIFSFYCNGKRTQTNTDLASYNPFQKLIDSIATNNKSVVGILFHIESPVLNISWTGAAGYDEIGKKSVLKANQPFRIASITKTFVATAILRLYEDKKLSLDDTIGKYVSKTHMDILNKDLYATNKITIRHLLNHTHGIYDYAMADLYFRRIIEDPDHWWTRTEQLEIAVGEGKPQGIPGDRFYYSDTGYILLGEIIEAITGKSLAESIRDLIGFKRLGLNSTWLESFEKNPAWMADIVHPYYNGKDYYHVSASIDLYGGGGYISTVKDISIFYQSLFGNKVFKKQTTLDSMLTPSLFPAKYTPPQDYRMGIQVSEIDGTKIYYHTGIWGSIVAYVPEFRSALAINFTQDYDPKVIIESLSILKQMFRNHGGSLNLNSHDGI